MPDPAPLAPRRDVVHREHGIERPDPWAWLRDRDDPAVHAHLQAENAFTAARTAHLEPLRQRLVEEILGRIQEDDAEVPCRRGAWVHYTRTEALRPYALHCRRPVAGGDEEVVLDENDRAEGSGYYHLGAIAISPNDRWLAWAEDTDGSESYTIRFRDLDTAQDLPHRIAGAKPSLAWANDDRTLFYTVPDPTDRPYRVVRHRIDTPGAADDVVLEEPDAAFYVDVRRTRDGRFVVAEHDSKITSECHVLEADDPNGAFRVLRPRRPGVEYAVDHHGDRFLLRINDGDARNFRVIAVRDRDGGGDQEVIAHDPAVHLTRMDAFAEHLVVWERRDGLPGIRVHRFADAAEHRVSFAEAVFEVGPDRNPEFDTHEVRFAFQSPVTPPSVYSYDLETRERVLLKRQPVPGYDPALYDTARVWATSHDGARVPVSLVFRRDLRDAGPRPMFLVGYGAYGLSYPVAFRNAWVSLLDRGVVCGVAHVRGGSELGRSWYDAGKLAHKTNTFLDFAAAADHLVAEGITRPDRLAIQGASAGGLLMGWVVNRRPDLCRAVLTLVPFLDLVTTMSDATLPLTVTEYEEWGDPRERATFEHLLSYSPYDNVTHGAPAPNVLATAGLNDPRVGYWEPAKWVQRLRERTHGGEILLRVNLGAGHGGASGRYGRVEETAQDLAWVLGQIGEDPR